MGGCPLIFDFQILTIQIIRFTNFYDDLRMIQSLPSSFIAPRSLHAGTPHSLGNSDGTSRVPLPSTPTTTCTKKRWSAFSTKAHWSYVGLEAEVPEVGDFKRTVVGERSVIMTRSPDGEMQVFENVCAHRGMQFAVSAMATQKSLFAPTTSGATTCKANLQGVPFRRGVRQDGKVNGGMPADFDPKTTA
jgi:salicylate 5-hydroxylase large subunit